MPLKLGMQKLVNQWVNVNKEHVVFSRESGKNSPTAGGSPSRQSSPKIKSHRRAHKRNSEDDGCTVVTASTADATASVSTMSTNRSGPQKANDAFPKVPPQVPTCISLANLSFSRHLRRGGFGISYSGKWSTDKIKSRAHQPIAERDKPEKNVVGVEIQVVTTLSSPEQFHLEISALKQLPPHANLNQLHGWAHLSAGRFDNKESYGLVYTLDQRLSQMSQWISDIDSTQQQVPKTFYWDILGGVINGLSHLHSHGIEHGSLTPDNILVHARRERGNVFRMNVKVADFGLLDIAEQMKESEEKAKSSVNKSEPNFKLCSRYSSPEFIRSQAISSTFKNMLVKFKSDIFSYGVIAWFLTSREIPFADHAEDIEVFEMICNGLDVPYLPLHKNMPKYLRRFLEKCWSSNPRARPSAEEIANRSLKELKDVFLTKQELDWTNSVQGHQVYEGNLKTADTETYESSQIEIPHRKMSELSVQDASTESDPEEKLDSKTNPALQIYPPKRNLDMDVSILTKSQRKGLIRLKRLKFSRNKKEKLEQKQKKIEITEDSSNSTSSKRSWLRSNKKKQENTIPFAPILASTPIPVENGPIAIRPPNLPLIQPMLPNPQGFNPPTNINGGLPDPISRQIPSPPIQILHFDHSDPCIDNHVDDDDLFIGQGDSSSSDEDLVIRKPHTFPQDYTSKHRNIPVGFIAPPKNFRSVFRTNSCPIHEMKINKEEEEAKLDAVEVLTSHFSRK